MAGKIGDKSVVDISSPYFISASDNPEQIFVGELLRDGNYGDWANEMSNALFAKNKIGFVDGTITMQELDSSDLMNWKRCNAMVKGWLTSAMEKEIRSSVKYAATAYDIWTDLQERFGKENAPRTYELRRAITMTRQEGLSVSAYYTKLRGFWDEIQSVTPTPKCTCGACTCDLAKEITNLREKERLYDFLMGLNKEYGAIKTQILSSRPGLTLGAAYHLIAQDEQQRLIGASRKGVPESAAFQISKHTTHTSKPVFQSSNKREDRGGRDKRSDKNDGRRCSHCHKTGHTVDGCFEITGYPDWWVEKYGGRKLQPRAAAATSTTDSSPIPGMTNEQFAALVKAIGAANGENNNEQVKQPQSPIANMTGKIDCTSSWVIDSGANEHITYNENLLEVTNKTGGVLPVKIPNGDLIPVKNVGDVRLPNGLQIKRVLNVPAFNCNLLSVSKLTRDLDCSLTFFSDMCVMQDLRSRNLIGMGRARDGL